MRLTIEGKVDERIATGRRRTTYLEGLTSLVALNLTRNELLYTATDRQRFTLMVTNVRY